MAASLVVAIDVGASLFSSFRIWCINHTGGSLKLANPDAVATSLLVSRSLTASRFEATLRTDVWMEKERTGAKNLSYFRENLSASR